MTILRMPRAPRFDMESGANPFEWINKAAEQHRAQRLATLEQRRRERAADNRALSSPIAPSK